MGSDLKMPHLAISGGNDLDDIGNENDEGHVEDLFTILSLCTRSSLPIAIIRLEQVHNR